jgi:hypothetical protein
MLPLGCGCGEPLLAVLGSFQILCSRQSEKEQGTDADGTNPSRGASRGAAAASIVAKLRVGASEAGALRDLSSVDRLEGH